VQGESRDALALFLVVIGLKTTTRTELYRRRESEACNKKRTMCIKKRRRNSQNEILFDV
jgi:hypothetical protein